MIIDIVHTAAERFGEIDMSMFGDGTTKEEIYQELKWIFDEEYKYRWEGPEGQLNFTMDVLDALLALFGEL